MSRKDRPPLPELVLLGRTIADLRLRANLTQLEVSNCLGVTKQCIGQWERGERAVPIDDLCRLAGLYSRSAGEVFGMALDQWVPPTLDLVEVEGPQRFKRVNGRKRHAG